ncbi:hypothetical protein I4U23_018233 [Adineta vaga]|nr:hypothetical protein I4U23_018233 [Adineta vaga]
MNLVSKSADGWHLQNENIKHLKEKYHGQASLISANPIFTPSFVSSSSSSLSTITSPVVKRFNADEIDTRKSDDWNEIAPKETLDKIAKIPDGWLEYGVDNRRCKIALGYEKCTLSIILNPNYEGHWSAPFIDNPNYRGKWELRKIPNPDYVDELHPYKSIPIGTIEKKYADQLWKPKSLLEEKVLSPPPSTHYIIIISEYYGKDY